MTGIMTLVREMSPVDVDGLLQETSRTFALAVPLLGAPTRRAVGLAYLLFRSADTLEDASTWSAAERRAALETFAEMLAARRYDREVVDGWLARGVTSHAGYARLLRQFPELMAEIDALPTAEILRRHGRRMALGMRDMIEPSERGLANVEELRAYCYIVAGIVGELLTELFVHDAPGVARVEADLHAHERAFGEGLQLVNILKDEVDDRAEGRSFLPAGVTRSDVIDLAAADLRAARQYIGALDRAEAPRGMRAFTALPCELAEKTLAELQRQGPGAKVPRAEVLAMFARYSACANSAS